MGRRRSRGKTMKVQFRTTPHLRAKAVVVLGMLSLQNESLAKEAVPAIGQTLATSSDPQVRANAIVALADLCKRYAVLVDPYLPTVTRCLKDPDESVRHLVLLSLLRLLQQDFVKLHGSMFYRLLTCLVDQSKVVRDLAEFGLVDRVCKRFPHVFYQRFVESLRYFNQYQDMSEQHSSQGCVIELQEQDKRLFSMEGEGNRERRMGIYRFLLQHMADDDRFKLNLAITLNVLGPCIEEGQEGVDTLCPEMLQDALKVLCCEEMKLQSIVGAEEAAADEEPALAQLITTRKTLLSGLVKKSLVENVVPVVLALKHKLEAARSPLLRAILLFLRELMRDYKNEVKDILAHDPKTASEVAFDLKRLEQEEDEEVVRAKEGGPALASMPSTPARTTNPKLMELLDTARKLKEEACKRRSLLATPSSVHVDGAAPTAKELRKDASFSPKGVVAAGETPKKSNGATSTPGCSTESATPSRQLGAATGETTPKGRRRVRRKSKKAVEQEDEEDVKMARKGGSTLASTPRTPARGSNSKLNEILDTAQKLKEEVCKRRSLLAMPSSVCDDGAALTAQQLKEDTASSPKGVISAGETLKKSNGATSTPDCSTESATQSPQLGAAAGKTTKKRGRGVGRKNKKAVEREPEGESRLE